MPETYLYGYASDEQKRLIAQAEYWREKVITPGLGYKAGQSLLDIGCGVGAVLGVIAKDYPGLILAGIDREPKQIETAKRHLSGAGVADLRVGDAAKLPWADGTFDHAFVMWFLEHLRDPDAALKQAFRVLKPGGTITCIETDYSAFKVWPQNKDWDVLERAQFEHFKRHGSAIAGRRLGEVLPKAGFESVESRLHTIHYTTSHSREELKRHANYVADFMAPVVPELAKLGGPFDAQAMARGAEYLRTLSNHPEGLMVNLVYRARGTKPKA
jgi:ubiquinone/menaquinone biosynthesis C-methylase UbiE